jgi:hypothetical protein
MAMQLHVPLTRPKAKRTQREPWKDGKLPLRLDKEYLFGVERSVAISPMGVVAVATLYGVLAVKRESV